MAKYTASGEQIASAIELEAACMADKESRDLGSDYDDRRVEIAATLN